jgi:hypothetical protein
MAIYGEGGALLSSQEPLGWGCGRILGKGGKNWPTLQNLSRGMAQRLAFGITGVGNRL